MKKFRVVEKTPAAFSSFGVSPVVRLANVVNILPYNPNRQNCFRVLDSQTIKPSWLFGDGTVIDRCNLTGQAGVYLKVSFLPSEGEHQSSVSWKAIFHDLKRLTAWEKVPLSYTLLRDSDANLLHMLPGHQSIILFETGEVSTVKCGEGNVRISRCNEVMTALFHIEFWQRTIDQSEKCNMVSCRQDIVLRAVQIIITFSDRQAIRLITNFLRDMRNHFPFEAEVEEKIRRIISKKPDRFWYLKEMLLK